MSFQRFILVIVLAGAAVATAILVVGNYVNAQRRRDTLAHAQQAIKERVVAHRQRHADIIVDAVTLAGDGKVLSTRLIWQPYAAGPKDELVRLPLHRVTIPGDALHLNVVIASFDKNPGPTGFLAGRSVPFYGYLYGDGQRPAEGVFISALDPVPDIFREKPERPNPTQYETGLWQLVQEAMKEDTVAKQRGIRLTVCEGTRRTVKLGMLYHVWVSGDSQIGVEVNETNDEPQTVLEIRRSAATQPGR